MRAPERLVVQLEHEIVGRVLDHPDLLENDLSLEREIGVAQRRAEDDVADDVGGLGRCSSSTRALIHRVLARRVRVERAAERLERQRDLVRAAALACP